MPEYKIRLGKLGEAAVVRWLRRQGGVIVARNRHYAGGELDIVAWWQERWCFIEVKTRRQHQDRYGGLEEAVTDAKLERLEVASQAFLQGVAPGSAAMDLVAFVALAANERLSVRFLEINRL